MARDGVLQQSLSIVSVYGLRLHLTLVNCPRPLLFACYRLYPAAAGLAIVFNYFPDLNDLGNKQYHATKYIYQGHSYRG